MDDTIGMVSKEKEMKYRKGDKVRNRYGKVETVVCVNQHGNVVTVDSRGYKGGEYHPSNLTRR